MPRLAIVERRAAGKVRPVDAGAPPCELVGGDPGWDQVTTLTRMPRADFSNEAFGAFAQSAARDRSVHAARDARRARCVVRTQRCVRARCCDCRRTGRRQFRRVVGKHHSRLRNITRRLRRRERSNRVNVERDHHGPPRGRWSPRWNGQMEEPRVVLPHDWRTTRKAAVPVAVLRVREEAWCVGDAQAVLGNLAGGRGPVPRRVDERRRQAADRNGSDICEKHERAHHRRGRRPVARDVDHQLRCAATPGAPAAAAGSYAPWQLRLPCPCPETKTPPDRGLLLQRAAPLPLASWSGACSRARFEFFSIERAQAARPRRRDVDLRRRRDVDNARIIMRHRRPRAPVRGALRAIAAQCMPHAAVRAQWPLTGKLAFIKVVASWLFHLS